MSSRLDGSSIRTSLLTRLLTAVRARGGQALLALGETEHPVLYVRYRGRTVPVVVVQAIGGGHWFIWGRSSFLDTSQVERAAEVLAPAPSLRPPRLRAVA
ncbi:hypothetical protein [Nocardiopsis potens]|uniref:hypothetical protein n=1 Tax=Nocardiopsis potens TaxID=1246458 RepID=UPI00034D062C|nr:hypothetical protein [Nocardiopsis potens]